MGRSRRNSADVVLVGLMGAGKTTIAGALASRLGVCAGDSDSEVERMTAMSVAEVFAAEGEPAFRTFEVQAVERLLTTPEIGVIALGGGAFMTSRVRELCRQHGARTIYLYATPEDLLARLEQTDIASRPLLGEDPAGVIRRLYSERDPVYRQAEEVVVTSGRPVEEIVNEVLSG